MERPSDVLRGIAAKGRKIQADIIAARQSKRSVDTNAGLVIDALDIFFDLSDRKRMASRLAKKVGHSSADSRMLALESEVDKWVLEGKDVLKNITVLQKGPPGEPNSTRLVRGFSVATGLKTPENRLSRGIIYLENLAENSIAYNNELKGMRESVSIIEASGKRELPSEIEERLALLVDDLVGFPTVREAVQGTLKAYHERGPDWGRQTLGSIRNALESLVKLLSGEEDWSKGLVKLIPSESRRKPIRATYDFLSNVGTHNKDLPAAHEVDYSIVLTEKAIKYIIAYPKAPK